MPSLPQVGDGNPTVPTVPPGLPKTDPNAPKWALTQDQIDFLVNTVTGYWPAFKTYWPVIVFLLATMGITGFGVGRGTTPTPTPVDVITPVPQVEVWKATIFAQDAKVYEGSKDYDYKGNLVPMPCVVLEKDGVVMDVKPFTTLENVLKKK